MTRDARKSSNANPAVWAPIDKKAGPERKRGNERSPNGKEGEKESDFGCGSRRGWGVMMAKESCGKLSNISDHSFTAAARTR